MSDRGRSSVRGVTVEGLVTLFAMVCAGLTWVAQVRSAPIAGREALPPDGIVFVRIPVEGAGVAGGAPVARDDAGLPYGSHILLLRPGGGAELAARIENLTPQFAAAGHPDVSFDGRRVLFVGKRDRDDVPQVWEVNVDGTGLRQVTHGPGAKCDAIYLSTIYTIDADAPMFQIAFCSRGRDASSADGARDSGSRDTERRALFTCHLDGQEVHQITFTPEDVSDPFLLSDGRILFSSHAVRDDSASSGGSTSLTAVQADGADVVLFTPDSPASVWRGMPCETADGSVVFVESSLQRGERGGRLASVRLVRSLHSGRRLTEVADGLYCDPAPTANGDLLVSHRPAGDVSYGLYVFDPERGAVVSEVIDTPDWHEVEAMALRPRRQPPGRSSVVNRQHDTGFLYCLNAYLSEVQEADGVGDAAIAGVRLLRAGDGTGTEPQAGGADAVGDVLLGDFGVEADGSFFLELPAQTPIRLETLGADGDILRSMQSWFWVMPNEHRGCIGCHEDRELSPPDRHPLALRRAAHRVEMPKPALPKNVTQPAARTDEP